MSAADSRPEIEQGTDEEPSMRLLALYRYPVKSARAEPLMTATLEPEGIAGDRRFVVTDKFGTTLTQRSHPMLATLEAHQQGDTLHLRAGPRAHNVTVRTAGPTVKATVLGSPVQLVDQGAAAGAWLAGFLDGGGGIGAVLPAIFGAPYKLLRTPGAVSDGSIRGGAGLTDASPLHLVCSESLDALNARRSAAGQPPVMMDRWRPNMVVSCRAPHVEDTWRSVRVGAATLQVSGPCPRCTVPDVQQQTGSREKAQLGPMKTLREYRSGAAGVLFGIYLTPVSPGVTVRVGDPVQGLP